MPAAGKTGALVLTAAGLLAVAGCARPDWTDPETSKGSRALPAHVGKAIPTVRQPAPPAPAWLAPLLGRPLRAAFPRDGVCLGNTDNVILLYAGEPRRGLVVGWGWEVAAKAPLVRVVLTDTSGAIIGGGVSGLPRPDVPKAMPAVTSDKAGWEAVVPVVPGRVSAYGVVEGGRAVCPLAGTEF